MNDGCVKPLKTLCVNGKLSDFEISQKIVFDYCGLNQGNWEISLADISYLLPNRLQKNILMNISSNFITNYEILKGKITLKNTTLMKFEIPQNSYSGVIYFPNRWFIINNVSDKLILFFEEWPLKSLVRVVPLNTDISVTVLLRRIN